MNQGEVRRRIVAARILLDIDQDEMSARGHAKGLGKVELGRVERGDKPVQEYHLPMLAEILEVPISWFTEPRDVIVAQRPADHTRLLDDLRQLIEDARRPQAKARRTPPPARVPRTQDRPQGKAAKQRRQSGAA